MDGVTLQRLKEGPVEAEAAGRPPEFRTTTGRIEFYSERMKQYGQELPVYIEPVESARQEKAQSYPLSLISPHARYRLHSTMVNVPPLSRLERGPCLEISQQDARHRNIDDGDVVRVFNDRGQIRLRARLADGIKPGVVAITEGWWTEQYVEGNLNQLTHDMINPAQQSVLGPNAALCDVLVEVQKEP